VAFTALSVDAPIKVKKRWDPHMKKTVKDKKAVGQIVA
jgi:hypothetical protein